MLSFRKEKEGRRRPCNASMLLYVQGGRLTLYLHTLSGDYFN